MNKWNSLMLIMLALLFNGCEARESSTVHDPGGFRGLHWGQSLPQQGFRHTYSESDETKWYWNENERDEDYYFGPGRALNIYYHFWKGRFYE